MEVDEIEIAYYLDGRQLLLLLSLIDQRPVAGLRSPDEPADWQSIALDLVRDGRLSCRNDRLVIERELAAILLSMKDAAQVYAFYEKDSVWVRQVFYEGNGSVLLELFPTGQHRLHRMEEREFRLLLEKSIPQRFAPEALETALPDNENLMMRIKEWESEKIALEEPAEKWLRIPEVRCVLERLAPPGRWIWVTDPLADLLVRQDRDGICVKLDTRARRRKLIEEMRWEG